MPRVGPAHATGTGAAGASGVAFGTIALHGALGTAVRETRPPIVRSET
jgi:hypothetical protein